MTALGRVWIALLILGAAGAAALQVLGPPPANEAMPLLAAPQPALLEPSSDFPGTDLPRIAPDGRKPMAVYARPAGAVPAGTRGRVAILVTGPGPDVIDWLAVIDRLPGAVSVALSPYVARPAELADAVRRRGHEILVSVPMEPDNYPMVDEGFRSLLLANDPQLNREDLEWTLTRFSGYVGATGAFESHRGARYAASAPGFDALTEELAHRGLLYVDPRPGRTLGRVTGRGADMVIDGAASPDDLAAALRRLDALGCEHGAALLLLSMPRAASAERVADWARRRTRCSALVPVSAVAEPPTAADAGATPP